jgi:tetratricopeptide (TPR) repeat protein
MYRNGYLQLAVDFLSINEKGCALDVLKEAWEMFPGDAIVLWGLANVYEETGNEDLAKKLYAELQAMACVVPDCEIGYNAEQNNLFLKKYPKALELFREHQTMAPCSARKRFFYKVKRCFVISQDEISDDYPG